MEKNADDEFVVSKKGGVMLLKLPGGAVTKYDYRFSDCPDLKEGEIFVKANLENKDD